MLWTMRLESKIYTIIVNEFPERLKKKYNMTNVDNFSTKDSNVAPATFPFVKIKELKNRTIAKTLRQNTKPGVDYSVQIDITAKSKESAKEIAGEIEEILIGKGFDCQTTPNGIVNGVDKYVIQANRIICYGDKL